MTTLFYKQRKSNYVECQEPGYTGSFVAPPNQKKKITFKIILLIEMALIKIIATQLFENYLTGVVGRKSRWGSPIFVFYLHFYDHVFLKSL
jgi:hypothetical protein